MLKKVNAIKARQNLGEIMNEVNLRNDEYIVERNGKPIAAIVPVWLVENQRRHAEGFLQVLNKHRDANSLISDDDAMALATEAIHAVRAAKHDGEMNV